MPLSTSSSDNSSNKVWWLVWAVALVVSAALLGSAEVYWRGKNYRAELLDSTQLWAVQRDRLYASDKIPLAILGASRIEFGLDLKLFAELLPEYRPVMLAVNGHYPISSLRDLAEDERFKGVVLCDVDSRGLSKIFWEMQAGYTRYYHSQWTPSWWAHRQLLNHWQRHLLIANPDFGIIAALKRWIAAGAEPTRSYHYFHRDRSGDIDFNQTDVSALTQHFERELTSEVATKPLSEPGEWLSALDEVNGWVRKIQARGGQVIFYETPTSGALHKIEQTAYPREKYWDRFAAATPALTLNSADEPRLAGFALPDQSHLDMRDKADYTRALTAILLERGLLRGSSASGPSP